MERQPVQTIGDVLRQTLSQSSLEERLQDVRAAAAWPMVVGNAIASQCGKPFASRGILTVAVRNASLRQELSMVRSSIVAAINKEIGSETLKDIRLVH